MNLVVRDSNSVIAETSEGKLYCSILLLSSELSLRVGVMAGISASVSLPRRSASWSRCLDKDFLVLVIG